MATILTRVRLNGFKTFAQRVEIDLNAPLTAIVGPNGCGKSNLVDAIIWALGETSVRTLRASTPTEVLFNGSATHKPMGLAEVSLWFNNETRWLPLDVDEVQITRRLYRSGEWECWINKTPARLRDIADLFAGTGLGRGGYAIVGQGDIEAFLNADPDQRRLWIEEVAGITLYRQRRRTSLRDLESAQMHLKRIEDVIRELERQREPLREQAERALVYRELQHQLTQLERQRLLYEWHTLQHQLQQSRQERETLHEQIIHTELLIGEHEQQASDYGQQIATLESQMDTLRTLLQGQMNTEERLLGHLHALSERERTLQELHHTLTDETESLARQEEETKRTLVQLQTELQESHQSLLQTEELLQTATHTTHRLAQQKAELDQRYQAILHQRASYEQSQQRRQQIELQIQELEQNLHKQQAEIAILQQAVEQTKQAEQIAQETVDTLEQSYWAQERELQALQRELQTAIRQREALQARARALSVSLQSGEGANPTLRSLLQAVKKGEISGEFYPVASILSVPSEYLNAIHAGLGNASNDLITPTEVEARKAIEWLKAQRAGRLTFLPLDLIQPPPEPKIPKAEGVIGLASQLVQTETRFLPIVRHLLGRVLVVETLEHAIALLRTFRQEAKSLPFSRIVTLEGELLHPSGALTGGTFATERQSMLHLKAELDTTLHQLQQAEQQVQSTEASLECARTAYYQLHQQLQEARTRLREATQARLQAENALKLAHQSLHSWQQQHRQLLAEYEQVSVSASPALEQEFENILVLRRALESEYEQSVQRLSELRALHQRLTNRQQELKERIGAVRQQLQQLETRRKTRTERQQSIEQELAQIAQQRQQTEGELEQVRARITDLQVRLENLRTERQQLLETSFALTDKVRTYRQQLQSLSERERSLELQIARSEVRLSDIQEQWGRLFPDEPFPAEYTTLPERPPVSRAEIEKLRRTLQEMGEVNLGATEEYARLTERYNTLERQRADLELTCERLLTNLRDLDAEAQNRFLDMFQRVRSAFQERFRQLFEGGQVDLLLTDERDPLSAGVIVEAQPPGKRRQRLELLSGGERALTAIAILFALADVRPSPLYILDEVDAALDGRNVQRFAEHLKTVAQNTQVLIVTHNPITSAVADHWLGISMTGGVSRVVPYTPSPKLVERNGADLSRAVILSHTEQDKGMPRARPYSELREGDSS